MITALAFVAAAASGALLRAQLTRGINRPDGFPAGTAAVNVSGSFLLGLLAGTGGPLVTVLGVGALGAYTTFSTFAADALDLGARRRPGLVVVYVAVSVFGSVLAAAGGAALAEL